MSTVIVKGTNRIKGLALLGLMVAMVGVFAGAPPAFASAASLSASSPLICPSNTIGKINLVAVDGTKGDNVAGATVAVYNTHGVVVLKGTTDAEGNFSSYICAATYKVKVFANGYKEFGETVTVTSGQPSFVKAALQPAASPRISSR